MDVMFLRVLALTSVFFCAVNSAEICRRDFYIQETINMFENYTDLVSMNMDCSSLSKFPDVILKAEPRLIQEMSLFLSINAKVAYSIKCTGYNETVYYNKTVGVRRVDPWTTTHYSRHNLPSWHECSVIGCFWDSFGREQRRYAVQGSSCSSGPNECLEEPAVCEQLCTNTDTGYNCACWEGYELDSNSHNCTDVDECIAGQHTCSHICSNTEGSYICSCPTGFQLDNNNTTCSDINECDATSPICEHECKNAYGSFVCTCSDGFELDNDGVSCRDIDECSTQLYSNQCEHSCTNSFGSYGCTCNSGFYLSTDQRSCLDIDECEISEPCSQLCVNTAGSYYCQCVSKYTLNQDAHTCTLSEESEGSRPVTDYLVFYLAWLIPITIAFIILVVGVVIYFKIRRR